MQILNDLILLPRTFMRKINANIHRSHIFLPCVLSMLPNQQQMIFVYNVFFF